MQTKSIKVNVFFNLIYQILAVVLPLITMPYVSRVLGVNNIGINSYTLSIVSYFTMFAAFGLDTYAQREIARNRNDQGKISKLFWEIVCNRLLTSSVVLILYIILFSTIFEHEYQTYYLILMLNILTIMFDIAWFFQGIEDFKTLAIRGMLIKISATLFTFIFVKTANDLWIYILINSLGLFLSTLTIWPMTAKYITKTKIEFRNVFYHFKGSIIYFVPAISIQIYTILDKSMIQWITNSNVENGLYESAEKISKATLALVQVSNTVLKSRMAYLFATKNEEKAYKLMDTSLSIISLLVYPMALGIILVAPNFVPLYLGDEYNDSIILLQIFSLLIIFIGFSGMFSSTYLTPIGKQGTINGIFVFGALFNLCMNFILIPYYGSIGATIASVTSEGLIAALFIYFSRKFYKPINLIKIGYKHIIAAALMFVGVYFSCNYLNLDDIWILLIKIFEGILIYFIVLVLLQDKTLYMVIDSLKNKITKHKK